MPVASTGSGVGAADVGVAEGVFVGSGVFRAVDEAAADAHAEIAAQRRLLGRPISQSDAMIAGIVHAHGATLATRNIRDFEGCAIALVDPWH